MRDRTGSTVIHFGHIGIVAGASDLADPYASGEPHIRPDGWLVGRSTRNATTIPRRPPHAGHRRGHPNVIHGPVEAMGELAGRLSGGEGDGRQRDRAERLKAVFGPPA